MIIRLLFFELFLINNFASNYFFIVSFLKNLPHTSVSKRGESVVALKVKRMPIGKNISEDNHIPENAFNTPSRADFSPIIDIT